MCWRSELVPIILLIPPHTHTSLVQFSQAVVVLNSQGPLSSLYNTYFNTLTASTLQDLERYVLSFPC